MLQIIWQWYNYFILLPQSLLPWTGGMQGTWLALFSGPWSHHGSECYSAFLQYQGCRYGWHVEEMHWRGGEEGERKRGENAHQSWAMHTPQMQNLTVIASTDTHTYHPKRGALGWISQTFSEEGTTLKEWTDLVNLGSQILTSPPTLQNNRGQRSNHKWLEMSHTSPPARYNVSVPTVLLYEDVYDPAAVFS